MTSAIRVCVASMLAAVVAVAINCGGAKGPGSQPVSPTSTGPSSAPNGRFDVAVIVDPAAVETTDADIRRVFDTASAKLRERTGETMAITEISRPSSPPGNVRSLVDAYLASRPRVAPEGVVVVTHDETAHVFGGYSYSQAAPFTFVNEYPSPVVGADKIYVSAIEFTHPYARCGYNDALQHVSGVSIDGECRNRPGTLCVLQGAWWKCADALSDLYSSDDYFTGCSIVHEFVHPFGTEGNYDHWGTPQCMTRTGMDAQRASDLREGQAYCQMCPDVYAKFRRQ
jgi:hypothetical protein